MALSILLMPCMLWFKMMIYTDREKNVGVCIHFFVSGSYGPMELTMDSINMYIAKGIH